MRRFRLLLAALLLAHAGAAPAAPVGASVRASVVAPGGEPAPLLLRGDVVVRGDVVTLDELVEGAPDGLAGRALFRSPALGETGTIQTRRIVEAAAGLGLPRVETGGRGQITVTRAARRVGTDEIEAAVKVALLARHGLDPRSVAIVFDGALPALAVPPDLDGPLTAPEVAYDPRSRRVTALVALGATPTERRAQLRVAGAVVETVEVALLTRSLGRGEAVKEGDVASERRPRETAPADALSDASALLTQVARRPLTAGALLRAGDLAKPEIVGRGDGVTIVFEAPGLNLALRGRANEGGGLGDLVAVVNPATKKVLQATVIGPGRVSVSAPPPGRLAGLAPTPPARESQP